MKNAKRILHRCLCLCLAASTCGNVGCHCIHHPCDPPSPNVCVQPMAPRELTKVILPPYRIEPPDVLQIDAIRVVPKFPYHLRGLDSLAIQVGGTLPDAPLAGTFVIDPGVLLNLGPPYGSVRVDGMTIDEAKQAIENQLKVTLKDPIVSVVLGEISGKQQ